MRYKLNNFLKWSKLKVLQKNKIVKTSYIWLLIVPFATKLFSKIPDNFIFSIYGKTYELDLTLPFSWKVFFISALLFTLANLLFYIFAPNLVREYHDYGDFEAQGKTYKHLEGYFSKDDWSNSIERIHNNEGQQDPNELFWDMYTLRDTEHEKIFKIIVYVLYISGILLSTWIFVESIFWVISNWF